MGFQPCLLKVGCNSASISQGAAVKALHAAPGFEDQIEVQINRVQTPLQSGRLCNGDSS
jgi:hypothetical protein